ncbi:hypothetical protein AMTRI_Chr05g61010 [Amborella trichopoda]
MINVQSPLIQFYKAVFTASILVRSLQFSLFGVHLVYDICQEYIIVDNGIWKLWVDYGPMVFIPHFGEVFHVKIGGVYVCIYGAFDC